MERTIPALDDAVWKTVIKLPEQLPFPAFKLANNPGLQVAFLDRILYACLVVSDYLDTERFYLELEGKQQRRGEHLQFRSVK